MFKWYWNDFHGSYFLKFPLADGQVFTISFGNPHNKKDPGDWNCSIGTSVNLNTSSKYITNGRTLKKIFRMFKILNDNSLKYHPQDYYTKAFDALFNP